MEQKPLILITMGDPAGIGPEIIAKSLAGAELFDTCRPVVVGDAGVMKKQVEEMRLAVRVRSTKTVGEADPAPGTIDVLSLNLVNMNGHTWGRPDVSSGAAVVAYVKRAVDAALTHQADAIVTAPINKAMMNAAGYHFAGHTELLAALTQSEEYGMLFVGGGLRVILATIHLPLRDVANHISPAGILKSLRLAKKAMAAFGIENPRIGVAALNPHAGEGRLFGNEEWDQIMPAIIEARGEGINASDPIPADTLFYKAR